MGEINKRVVFWGEGLRFEFLNSGISMCLKRVTALPPMETLSPALWTGRRFVMWSGGVGEIRRVVFGGGGLRFEFLNSGIIMCLKRVTALPPIETLSPVLWTARRLVV